MDALAERLERRKIADAFMVYKIDGPGVCKRRYPRFYAFCEANKNRSIDQVRKEVMRRSEV
jgi:hypothetical protein